MKRTLQLFVETVGAASPLAQTRTGAANCMIYFSVTNLLPLVTFGNYLRSIKQSGQQFEWRTKAVHACGSAKTEGRQNERGIQRVSRLSRPDHRHGSSPQPCTANACTSLELSVQSMWRVISGASYRLGEWSIRLSEPLVRSYFSKASIIEWVHGNRTDGY